MKLLTICTANRCRSQMFAALLVARLGARGSSIEVASAGSGPSGQPVIPEAAEVMAGMGLDVGGHRSTRVSPESLADADLVVAMTRQHVADVAVTAPAAWPKTFPLIDLIDRGRQLGPRGASESLEAWVRRAHGGRRPAAVLALPSSVDIADPTGGPPAGYERTGRQLAALADELADLIAPPGPGHR